MSSNVVTSCFFFGEVTDNCELVAVTFSSENVASKSDKSTLIVGATSSHIVEET